MRQMKQYIKKYWILRAAILLGIAVLFLLGAGYLYGHNPVEVPFIPCIFYELTGLYCPGCGAGRASYAILHGQFYQAFRYNPLMIFVLFFLALYFTARGLDWLITGGNHIDRHIPDKYLYWLLVVIMIYGIIRNIPCFPFYLLAPCQV